MSARDILNLLNNSRIRPTRSNAAQRYKSPETASSLVYNSYYSNKYPDYDSYQNELLGEITILSNKIKIGAIKETDIDLQLEKVSNKIDIVLNKFPNITGIPIRSAFKRMFNMAKGITDDDEVMIGDERDDEKGDAEEEEEEEKEEEEEEEEAEEEEEEAEYSLSLYNIESADLMEYETIMVPGLKLNIVNDKIYEDPEIDMKWSSEDDSNNRRSDKHETFLDKLRDIVKKNFKGLTVVSLYMDDPDAVYIVPSGTVYAESKSIEDMQRDLARLAKYESSYDIFRVRFNINREPMIHSVALVFIKS